MPELPPEIDRTKFNPTETQPASIVAEKITSLEAKIAELIAAHFDLRPKGIVNMLDLLRPIYTETASYGHFGREEPDFTWEVTDKAAELKAAAGI